jgi:dTMP kinase
MAPRAEALLYAAARAQLVEEVVRPALARGAVVLTDRYLDSSIAYQGFGRELGLDDIITLSVWATDCLFPELTLYYHVSEEERSGRNNGAADRLEAESGEFFSRVETGYAHMADLHSHRFRVIDASGPVGEVYRRTRAAVNEEFGWLGTGAAAGGTRSGGPVVPAECDLEGHGTV